MRRFSSQYIITNSGPLLKRAIITVKDDGTIENIEDTKGDLTEKQSVEFYNGIIIPGFVNCHCHLELSHMKSVIDEGKGLGSFIEAIRTLRFSEPTLIRKYACEADNEMYNNGISLCADICNTSDTFELKKGSKISYINLLEVFGIDPDKAERRLEEILSLRRIAMQMNISYSLVPHSVYSMSIRLLRMLKNESTGNKVTSVHFMETSSESEFLRNHTGQIMTSYKRNGLLPSRLDTVISHEEAVLNEITSSGNLILIHNTFTDRETIRAVKLRKDLYWCLCPNSNAYIEKTMPPVRLLIDEGCKIVIGTDSLASNQKLDILSELITLQNNFPSIELEDLIRWSTLNGARALGEEEIFGTIEPGKRPGLLLLQNVDLQNMRLLPESFVTRLM